jgi:hypothetical protein
MVIVLGSFRLSFRGLRSSWHLGLLEADQQPRLRRVGAQVHDGNWKNLPALLLTSRAQRAPPVTKMVKSCSRPASLA